MSRAVSDSTGRRGGDGGDHMRPPRRSCDLAGSAGGLVGGGSHSAALPGESAGGGCAASESFAGSSSPWSVTTASAAATSPSAEDGGGGATTAAARICPAASRPVRANRLRRFPANTPSKFPGLGLALCLPGLRPPIMACGTLNDASDGRKPRYSRHRKPRNADRL